MKKLAAAILLLVYFAVTTGFVVSVHYCMDKLDSVELGYAAKEECGKCGMKVAVSSGCCKDEVSVVKLKTDHQASKLATPDFSLALLPNPATDFETSVFQPQVGPSFVYEHGPPLLPQSRNVLYCVFRI